MKYIEFDQTRPFDLVLLGRVAIDFNPAYNDQVKEEFKPLKKVHVFDFGNPGKGKSLVEAFIDDEEEVQL